MIDLMFGDCLERMSEIPDGSVDMILADPPYGTTACKWDSVIPLQPMWEQLKRVIKPNGAIVMTASQPFTTTLISSNMKMFKYCWVWQKDKATNFFTAKFQPLNNTEDVIVFSEGGCGSGAKNPVPYNPQGVIACDRKMRNSRSVGGEVFGLTCQEGKTYTQTQTGYPLKIIKFTRDRSGLHPTQKPIALMEYLINTYTNEDETVLDFAMGSGTTGVACKNLNRDFIGIELDQAYYNIAKNRLDMAHSEVI